MAEELPRKIAWHPAPLLGTLIGNQERSSVGPVATSEVQDPGAGRNKARQQFFFEPAERDPCWRPTRQSRSPILFVILRIVHESSPEGIAVCDATRVKPLFATE